MVAYLIAYWMFDLMPCSYYSYDGGVRFWIVFAQIVCQDFFMFIMHGVEHISKRYDGGAMLQKKLANKIFRYCELRNFIPSGSQFKIIKFDFVDSKTSNSTFSVEIQSKP